MARQVLPILGAVVGAFFGSPQIGFAIGAVIGNAVDPVVNQGPKIGETGAQTSQEGAPRAIIYGTASCTGNIIATGPVIKSTEVEEVEGGGKGSEKAENEHAYRNYAIRICEGPIAGILRIWEDDKLVYDVRAGSLMFAESQKWISNKNVFLGDEDQLPSIFLNLNVPPLGDHPAHRGTAYIVFGLEDLTERRGSIPQYRFEVAQETEDFVIDLTRVDVSTLAGISGGGSFTNYFLPVSEIPDNVKAINVFWRFNPADSVDSILTLQVKLGETVFWSQTVSLLGAQVDQTYQVQLNLIGAGQEITAGFSGEWVGRIEININYLAANFSPRKQSGFPPDVYEKDDRNYGIFLDEANQLYSAGQIAALPPVYWGPAFLAEGADGLPVGLDDIVRDIHLRCAVPLDKIDVSELTDQVAGLVLAGDYSGADAINTLRGPYFFDKAEYSKTLHYPKRGAAVVDTLTIDDLVEEPDLSKREQALEFAKKMHLFYQHAASGYAAVKATSLRSSPDARVVGEISLQVPVVLNEDQAAQTVSKLHKVSWAEAEGEVNLSVPSSFMRFVPSDCLGLVLRGQAKRYRLEKKEFADGVIKMTLRHDRQSAYTSNLTGVPIPPPTLPPSTIVGDTTLAILDIASRTDTEDDLNYLSAGVGALPAWYGYALQRSLDGGASYTTAGRYGPAVVGVLAESVAASSEFYTDTTNTVSVQLIRDGQLLSEISEVQFLSEQGAFALEKADGSWEVMQYQNVVQDSAGVFILSRLHRGLLNSGASAHSVGAKFVLLSRAEHIPAQSSWIGQQLTHRAVSLDDSPENATSQTQTYVGRSQIEWPVGYLSLTRDSSDNIIATWTPRHRFGSDDAPVASINFQGYRVTLNDGIAAPVTFDTLAAGFTYDASTLAEPVTVSVSALNRITGAGPATSESI